MCVFVYRPLHSTDREKELIVRRTTRFRPRFHAFTLNFRIDPTKSVFTKFNSNFVFESLTVNLLIVFPHR